MFNDILQGAHTNSRARAHSRIARPPGQPVKGPSAPAGGRMMTLIVFWQYTRHQLWRQELYEWLLTCRTLDHWPTCRTGQSVVNTWPRSLLKGVRRPRPPTFSSTPQVATLDNWIGHLNTDGSDPFHRMSIRQMSFCRMPFRRMSIRRMPCHSSWDTYDCTTLRECRMQIILIMSLASDSRHTLLSFPSYFTWGS